MSPCDRHRSSYILLDLSDVSEATLHLNALAGVLVKESKWTEMFFGEGQACLSFSHLNKDDEGLYTLRILSRGGVSEHSAFLFVRGMRLWEEVSAQRWGSGSGGLGWAEVTPLLRNILAVRWCVLGAHEATSYSRPMT